MEVPDWCCSDSVIAGLAAAGTHISGIQNAPQPCCSITDFITSSRNTVKGNLCHQQGFGRIERYTEERALGRSLEMSVKTENVAFYKPTCDNESAQQARNGSAGCHHSVHILN